MTQLDRKYNIPQRCTCTPSSTWLREEAFKRFVCLECGMYTWWQDDQWCTLEPAHADARLKEGGKLPQGDS